MTGPTTRGIVLAVVAPVVLGVLGAGALLASGRSLRLVVGIPLPLLAAVVGVLVGGVVLTAWLTSRAVARARAAGYDAGRAVERAAHRRFVARLDHELKNPVTAVRAAVAGLAYEDASTRGSTGSVAVDRTALVATADAQSARLATLVADLRKLAELETGPIEDEEVDMADVVREAVADIEAQATSRGVGAVVRVVLPEVPWPLPHVRGDLDLLYLAVHNLLSNAVKFSPAGALIEVRGADEDGTVVVEVADSGMGIPPDEVDSVFDELARGSQARGLPGSGLGLALVRVVAERHGGSATLRSRPGQGTSVRLRIPAAARA